MQPCPTCESLRTIGVKPVEPDPSPWIDSPPSEASVLEVFAPGQGHSDTVQIRRCRECGALYRYRYHNEYDVSGSWEEYFLWRMSDAAQPVIGAILSLPAGARADQLTAALQHAQADLREDAALLLWIVLDNGDPVPDKLLHAACEALTDPVHLVGNYCYRALLGYAYRGRSDARLLLDAITAARITERESAFGWILVKECSQILG